MGSMPRTRCTISALHDFAVRPFPKRSIDDLLMMSEVSAGERSRLLHETLKVGLARCAVRLSAMPLGFCNSPSIRGVTAACVDNLRQVMEFESLNGLRGLETKEYQGLTQGIYTQHRNTKLQVAKGVFEFYEDLAGIFGQDLEFAVAREDVPSIGDIEIALDDFFTSRLTLRLLISHVQKLNDSEADRFCGARPGGPEPSKVGVVNVRCEPLVVLANAYRAAKFMCIRDLHVAPELNINGLPYDEFKIISSGKVQCFPYVSAHIFYIFLELLKNAARGTVERARLEVVQPYAPQRSLVLPPIRVCVPVGSGAWLRERSIKLADSGTGMSRQVLNNAFCYFYSSVQTRPTVAAQVSDFNSQGPIAGFGFGLPMSRVISRYFGGDLDLHSIPGRGTDAYLYL